MKTSIAALYTNQHVENILQKGDRHILISKVEFILIVSGTFLQILRAIYDTVSVPFLTVLGFLE